MIALNKGGAGIFLTINTTDGRGRKEENIVAITAIFVDCDDGKEREFPFPPSIIVKTKNGWHYYFLLCVGQDMGQFEATQNALIKKLNTDKMVKDLPRVMRIPGFFHQKNPQTPYMVQLIKCDTTIRYTLAEIQKHFPIDERANMENLSTQKNKERKQEDVITSNSKQTFEVQGLKFMNVVGGACKALTRRWNSSHCNHVERVALLSIAIRCEDGLEEVRKKWPSEMTEYQIRYALENELNPYTCEKLQSEGICCECDPIYAGRCLLPRSSMLVSPVRFAYGVRNALKNKENIYDR